MLASLRLSNVQSNVTFGKIRRFYVLPNITCFLSKEYIYLMVIFLEAVVFFSTMANQLQKKRRRSQFPKNHQHRERFIQRSKKRRIFLHVDHSLLFKSNNCDSTRIEQQLEERSRSSTLEGILQRPICWKLLVENYGGQATTRLEQMLFIVCFCSAYSCVSLHIGRKNVRGDN